MATFCLQSGHVVYLRSCAAECPFSPLARPGCLLEHRLQRVMCRHRAEQRATRVGAAGDETPAPQSPSRLPGSLLPSDPVRAQTPAKALVAGSGPVTIVRTKDWTPARDRSRPA